MEKMKHTINELSIEDSLYPDKLRKIIQPPEKLYYFGTFPEQEEPMIAVVGSRDASYRALGLAEKSGYRLSARGITVVSGLASGTDTAAHTGTLRNNGRTISVLPKNLAYKFSKADQKLIDSILENNGCIISEYKPNKNARPVNSDYVKRNRIITGLSDAILVAECAKTGGTRHSVNFAKEQGKPIYALIPDKRFSNNYEFMITIPEIGISFLTEKNAEEFIGHALNKNSSK